MNLTLEQVDESMILIGQRLSIDFGEQQSLLLEINGGRGPQGPPGPSGAMLELVASGSISGHRAVCDASGLAVYADHSTEETAHSLVGVSYNAAITGGTVNVVTAGPLSDPAFSFIPGLPIYVGVAGALVQTAPTFGYIRRVGFARDATTVVVQIAQPIMIGA